MVRTGFKTRVRRGSCPRTAPLGARAEKRLSRETALRAKRGTPFGVTRYRVLKPVLPNGVGLGLALGLRSVADRTFARAFGYRGFSEGMGRPDRRSENST